ncbi:MAG: hypothetical protein ACTS45_00415 [Candidatus Hodgkinia cicadicola]
MLLIATSVGGETSVQTINPLLTTEVRAKDNTFLKQTKRTS